MKEIYPVMNFEEWEPGNPPFGAFPIPWGSPRLGGFPAAPLSAQNGGRAAVVSTPQMAFEVLGPYWNPSLA